MKTNLLIGGFLTLLAALPARSLTTCGGTGACVISKTQYEDFLVSVDFAQAAGTDEIVLDSVTSINSSTRQLSTSQIIAASPVPGIVPSTQKVAFLIEGGSSGQTHLISVKVIDETTGERFEGQISVVVN